MEEKDTILTFDTLYTTNEIQILKLALPLLSPSLRPFAALIIKGKELKYCMEQLPSGKIENASIELQNLDAFLENALPYCNKNQKQLFMQLRNIKNSIAMFEKMKGMMDLFGEDSFSDMGNLFQFWENQEFSQADKPKHTDKDSQTNDFSNSTFNHFIQNSLSPEQTEMFAKFKRQFEEEMDSEEI